MIAKNPNYLIFPTIITTLLITFTAVRGSYGNEPTLAQTLCAGYENIKTVSCEVRKTTTSEETTVRMLSRVYYMQTNLLHVENTAPEKRRIISDGKRLYYHGEENPRGFSRPLAELSEEWMTSVQSVPGSPMEHLLRLKTIPEVSLPATENYPVRRAYQAPKVYVVLSCNTTGQLVQIEFFTTSDMKKKTAQYNYSNFQQAGENCWIPCLHQGVLYMPDGRESTETRRIDNLVINEPIAANLFDPSLFFEKVDFVSDFEELFKK